MVDIPCCCIFDIDDATLPNIDERGFEPKSVEVLLEVCGVEDADPETPLPLLWNVGERPTPMDDDENAYEPSRNRSNSTQ